MTMQMKRRIIYLSRIAAWLLLLAITVLSLVPPNLRPETGAPHNIEHFAIFALAGFTFGVGSFEGIRLAAAALVAFTGTIELAQMAVPGRHARLSDFIVDALAMIVALGCGAVFVRAIFPPSLWRKP